MLRFNTTYNVPMRGATVLIVTILVCVAAQSFAQQITRVPAIDPSQVQRAFQNNEIYATPPTLPLVVASPLAHHGNLWLRTTDEGLHIWGRVEYTQGQPIQWAEQKSEILASDHVEIWLATTTDVPLPTIGWGNQFGMQELKSEKDCADSAGSHTGDKETGRRHCEEWYREQVQYRQQLRRLFTRQWLITGRTYSGQTHSFETFASSAYENLTAALFPENLPTLLKPNSDNPLKVEMAPDVVPIDIPDASGHPRKMYVPTSYRFHVLVPYAEFPPARELKLSDLYIAVAVFSPAPEGKKEGVYSATSATLRWGQPETFNHVVLETPRTFAVSPCDYKLEQQDLYGETFGAWFFPRGPNENELRDTFALINPEQGYLYDPGGVSPQIDAMKYFWKTLSDGGIVCGPKLGWRKGANVQHSKFTIDEEHFASRTLPDGWTLLQSGPWTSTVSTFGSGACGACPVLNFDIYAVSPAGEISEALDLAHMLTGAPEQPSGADMTIAPDLSTIVLYLNGTGEELYGATGWKSQTYCLERHAYKKCGEAKNVKPPDPPHFKELLGPE